ncbi:MAG: CsbD family protein [Polyangiales bacterium]|nr:CsbD family protein [Myxococcales bacterium]
MNWTQIEGKWDQMKGAIHSQWGKLTDDDLAVVRGKRQQLVGKIVERYGTAKEEAEQQIDAWLSKLDRQPASDASTTRS